MDDGDHLRQRAAPAPAAAAAADAGGDPAGPDGRRPAAAAGPNWGLLALLALQQHLQGLATWALGRARGLPVPAFYKTTVYKWLACSSLVFFFFIPVHTNEVVGTFYPFPPGECRNAVDRLEKLGYTNVALLQMGASGSGKTCMAEAIRWLCSGIFRRMGPEKKQKGASQTKKSQHIHLEGFCKNIAVVDLRGLDENMSPELEANFSRMFRLASEHRLGVGSAVNDTIEIPRSYWLWDFTPRTAVVQIFVHDAGKEMKLYDYFSSVARADYTKPLVALTKGGAGEITKHLSTVGEFQNIRELDRFYNESGRMHAFAQNVGIDIQTAIMHKNPYFTSATNKMVPGMRKEFVENQLCHLLGQAATYAELKAAGEGKVKGRLDYLVDVIESFKLWLFRTYLGYIFVRLLILVALGPISALLIAAKGQLAQLKGLKLHVTFDAAAAAPAAPAAAAADADANGRAAE